jgi:hypothetical protein
MSRNAIHDRASETEAVEGLVIVDGPDGVALTITPKAAATMARRLARSASKAQAQRSRRHDVPDDRNDPPD